MNDGSDIRACGVDPCVDRHLIVDGNAVSERLSFGRDVCDRRGADLFESYVGAIIASIALGLTTVTDSTNIALYPVLLAAIGIVASMIGTFAVRTNDDS